MDSLAAYDLALYVYVVWVPLLQLQYPKSESGVFRRFGDPAVSVWININ